MLLGLVVSVTRAPIAATTALSEEPTFTSFTSAPVLENRGEGFDALEREYSLEWRDAGIEGTTLVYLFVSATGVLENTVIAESSGHQGLDEAALRVARLFRFSAALDGDAPVAAWIQVPITFSLAAPPPCARCRGIGPAGPLAPAW
jgi:protein TonB